LTEPHLDQHLLYMIEAHPPDPRIAPALEAEFDRRGTKSEKQAIAATLIRLGDSSDRLFRFLSLFVLRAVEDRTPFPVMFDSDGHEVRGRFSAEFENWCALNHKEPRSTAAEQLVTLWTTFSCLRRRMIGGRTPCFERDLSHRTRWLWRLSTRLGAPSRFCSPPAHRRCLQPVAKGGAPSNCRPVAVVRAYGRLPVDGKDRARSQSARGAHRSGGAVQRR
jgi:hypothetical protein